MVSKEVLKRIGVFAVAAVVAVSPVLAVNANGGVQLLSTKAGTNDPGTQDPGASTEPTTPPGTVPTTPPPARPETVPTTAPAETPEDSSEDGQDLVADVVTTAGGTVLKSTIPGTYRVTVVEGIAITTPLAAVNAAFGAGKGDYVEMVCLDTRCGELALASINDGMGILMSNGIQAERGAVLDMMAYLNGQKVVDINNPITITLGLPASFRQAGYEYAVIRVQEGGRVSILPNTSEDPSILSVKTDGFGVFALIKAPAGSFDIFR